MSHHLSQAARLSQYWHQFYAWITSPNGGLLAGFSLVSLLILILLWHIYFDDRDYFLINAITPDHYQKFWTSLASLCLVILPVAIAVQLTQVSTIALVSIGISLIFIAIADFRLNRRLWKRKYPSLPYNAEHLVDKSLDQRPHATHAK